MSRLEGSTGQYGTVLGSSERRRGALAPAILAVVAMSTGAEAKTQAERATVRELSVARQESIPIQANNAGRALTMLCNFRSCTRNDENLCMRVEEECEEGRHAFADVDPVAGMGRHHHQSIVPK